jgi:hypothetical protein
MRNLIMALLMLPALAWGTGFPGCKYYKTVTYTTAKILENGTYAAYVDLSEMATTWWASCSLSTNIVVTDTANDTTAYLKYVDTFDKSTRTGILWFKLPATTASGGYAKIQTGKTVNVANNKKVFTDLNMYLRYGMEDASGSIVDATNDYAGTGTSVTYAQEGQIGNSIQIAGSGASKITIGDVTQTNGASKITVTGWVNISSFANCPNFWTRSNGVDSSFGVEFINNGGLWFNTEIFGQNATYAGDAPSGFTLFGFVFDGTLADATVRRRVQKNGANKTLTNSGTPGTKLPTLTSYNLILGNDASNSSSMAGYMDEFRMYSDAKSNAWLTTDYSLQAHKSVAVYSITDSGYTEYDQPPSQFVALGQEYADCDSIGSYSGAGLLGRARRWLKIYGF